MRPVFLVVFLLEFSCGSFLAAGLRTNTQKPLLSKFNSDTGKPLNARQSSDGLSDRNRCESCKEAPACKKLGLCVPCRKVCQDAGDPLPPITTLPTLRLQERGAFGGGNDQGGEVEEAPKVSAVHEKGTSDIYYSVGAFQKGIRQDLVGRLLNMDKMDKLDKLIVLAKPESSGRASENGHPIIIDTAGMFGQPSEVDLDVHGIQNGGPVVSAAIDALVKALEEAFEQKQEETGSAKLSEQEVDEIIREVMDSFDRRPKQLLSRMQNQNEEVGAAQETEGPKLFQKKNRAKPTEGPLRQKLREALAARKTNKPEATTENAGLTTEGGKPSFAARLRKQNSPLLGSRPNDQGGLRPAGEEGEGPKVPLRGNGLRLKTKQKDEGGPDQIVRLDTQEPSGMRQENGPKQGHNNQMRQGRRFGGGFRSNDNSQPQPDQSRKLQTYAPNQNHYLPQAKTYVPPEHQYQPPPPPQPAAQQQLPPPPPRVPQQHFLPPPPPPPPRQFNQAPPPEYEDNYNGEDVSAIYVPGLTPQERFGYDRNAVLNIDKKSIEETSREAEGEQTPKYEETTTFRPLQKLFQAGKKLRTAAQKEAPVVGNWFEDQYKKAVTEYNKAKDWLEENVGATQPSASDPARADLVSRLTEEIEQDLTGGEVDRLDIDQKQRLDEEVEKLVEEDIASSNSSDMPGFYHRIQTKLDDIEKTIAKTCGKDKKHPERVGNEPALISSVQDNEVFDGGVDEGSQVVDVAKLADQLKKIPQSLLDKAIEIAQGFQNPSPVVGSRSNADQAEDVACHKNKKEDEYDDDYGIEYVKKSQASSTKADGDAGEEEDVSCKKKKDEDYEGYDEEYLRKPPAQEETKPGSQEEDVSCKKKDKDDEYEYEEVYPSYRSNDEAAGAKNKKPIHRPLLEKLRNHRPQGSPRQEEGDPLSSNPQRRPGLNRHKQEDHEEIPQRPEASSSQQDGGDADDVQPPKPHRRPGFNRHKDSQNQAPLAKPQRRLGANRDQTFSPQQPDEEMHQRPRPKESRPNLNQRFGDEGQAVVGAENPNTMDPYTFLGRLIPRNDAFAPGGDRAVDFDGTGMRLPLKMEANADGSFSLGIDVDKLIGGSDRSVKRARDLKAQLEFEHDLETRNDLDVLAAAVGIPVAASGLAHKGKVKLNLSPAHKSHRQFGEVDGELIKTLLMGPLKNLPTGQFYELDTMSPFGVQPATPLPNGNRPQEPVSILPFESQQSINTPPIADSVLESVEPNQSSSIDKGSLEPILTNDSPATTEAHQVDLEVSSIEPSVESDETWAPVTQLPPPQTSTEPIDVSSEPAETKPEPPESPASTSPLAEPSQEIHTENETDAFSPPKGGIFKRSPGVGIRVNLLGTGLEPEEPFGGLATEDHENYAQVSPTNFDKLENMNDLGEGQGGGGVVYQKERPENVAEKRVELVKGVLNWMKDIAVESVAKT